MIDPPRWDEERLERDRLRAIEQFRHDRLDEPVELYTTTVDEQQGVVEELLEQTVDLQQLDDEALLKILSDPKYRDAFRYLAGPPISDDDWKTLAQVPNLTRKQLRDEPDSLRRLAEVVLNTIDRRRFPWLSERRDPNEAERDAAVLASACLWAYQQTQTERRSMGKRRLEGLVEECLEEQGFVKEPRRPVQLLSEAPGRGRFCPESSVAGRRADAVVGLWDGRHALIECKDSNSAVNSLKRLNDTTIAKANRWYDRFGKQQVVSVAVISGVFTLQSLLQAQKEGVSLFWGHDMEPFCTWIKKIRKPAG